MSQEPAPHLSVVAGNPTAEELAVVVAVVQAAGSGGSVVAPKPTAASTWASNAGRLRTPVVPGHNQWRASYRSGLN